MYGLADLLLKLLTVSLTWMYIDETVKNVFCLQLQIKSCIILICVHVHNKHKTKLNGAFHRTVLNTETIHNCFWRNLPTRARSANVLKSFILLVRKQQDQSVICAQKLKSLTAMSWKSSFLYSIISLFWYIH